MILGTNPTKGGLRGRQFHQPQLRAALRLAAWCATDGRREKEQVRNGRRKGGGQGVLVPKIDCQVLGCLEKSSQKLSRGRMDEHRL